MSFQFCITKYNKRKASPQNLHIDLMARILEFLYKAKHGKD